VSLRRRELLLRAGGGALALALPRGAAADDVQGSAGLSRRALRALRGAVRGPVLVPGTPGYSSARLVYNERFDGARPYAVVEALDTRDVQAAVRWADRFDVRVVPRSGGHSYAGYSTISRGVVVDVGRMRAVRVTGGRATVGAGTQLIDLYSALSRRGLLVPGGSCPSVGVAGLALGGGHGLSGRRFGLTSDNLRAATVVTASGNALHVDADTHEDLFWACRGGGGGNFGIATSLTFQAHRARGGSWFFVSWPWGAAAEALAAWQVFAPRAPRALTSIFSLGTTGGAGPPRVTAAGQHFGSESSLRRLIRPLAAVDGASVSSGSASMMGLALRWAGCLDDGYRACHTRGTRAWGALPRARFLAKSDYFERRVPAAGRRRMVDWIERRQRSPSLGSGALILDAYGGAYNRPAPDATAFVHRDALFSLQYLAYYGAGAEGASRSWIEGTWRALRPYASGEAYQNYIDPRLESWQRSYYGSNLARLREVKRRYDPDFRFRFRQAIPPAG
jgi:FAD/FMN-containing dehydrogenase